MKMGCVKIIFLHGFLHSFMEKTGQNEPKSAEKKRSENLGMLEI